MSLDKEPADVAMEFLAEDPAPPPQEGTPATPPTLKTAQDLLDWVKLDPDLGAATAFQRDVGDPRS